MDTKIIELAEMREMMAELDNQYRIRRLQEMRQTAVLEMLNLRNMLAEKPSN